MGAAVELCIGVFVAVGSALAAVGMGLIAADWWRPRRDLRPIGLSRAAACPEPAARAGPVLLSLLCVSRR
jgi:hypothetical protein